jgi:hypothetical protein
LRLTAAILLLTVACGRAERDRARDETILRTQLVSMRTAIAAYTKAHGHGPPSLRDAMPAVPVDPLTHSAMSWRLTTEERVQVEDFTTGKAVPKNIEIIEVHSDAHGRDGRGRAYSEY